jgi:hypothetical protein
VPGHPAGFPDAGRPELPDQLPWAEAHPEPGAWDAWAGVRRDARADGHPGPRDEGAGKSAARAQDGPEPGVRQSDGREWDEPGAARWPQDSPFVEAAWAPCTRGAARSAAQSCGAAERWAELGAAPERAALPPWAALVLAPAREEEPVLPRAERLARAEPGRPDEPVGAPPASAAARRWVAPPERSEERLQEAKLPALRERLGAEPQPAARPRACFPPRAVRRAREAPDASPAARWRPAAFA